MRQKETEAKPFLPLTVLQKFRILEQGLERGETAEA